MASGRVRGAPFDRTYEGLKLVQDPNEVDGGSVF